MLVSIWLISEGKSAPWAFYPMIFMFVTTIAALIYTSYNLLFKVFTGKVQGEALIGNTLIGCVGFFLVIAAIIGVPILPPYYSLRLLPYVVPQISTWKRRMLREKDLTDGLA